MQIVKGKIFFSVSIIMTLLSTGFLSADNHFFQTIGGVLAVISTIQIFTYLIFQFYDFDKKKLTDPSPLIKIILLIFLLLLSSGGGIVGRIALAFLFIIIMHEITKFGIKFCKEYSKNNRRKPK